MMSCVRDQPGKCRVVGRSKPRPCQLLLQVTLFVVFCLSEMEAQAVKLSEDDVPGASLGRNPDDSQRLASQLSVKELKRWLACRNARRSGTKPELLKR